MSEETTTIRVPANGATGELLRGAAIMDRAITALAQKMYDAYRDWDYQLTGRKLVPWGDLDPGQKQTFKRAAEIFVVQRKREMKTE